MLDKGYHLKQNPPRRHYLEPHCDTRITEGHRGQQPEASNRGWPKVQGFGTGVASLESGRALGSSYPSSLVPCYESLGSRSPVQPAGFSPGLCSRLHGAGPAHVERLAPCRPYLRMTDHTTHATCPPPWPRGRCSHHLPLMSSGRWSIMEPDSQASM